MPDDFAQLVKAQADIVRIVGEHVRLRKAGAQNWAGLCPFHSEKSGSFSVHAVRQFFHCFGCGASGDVFTFVMRMESLSFPEAVRAVAAKCGIALPKREFGSAEEAAEHRERSRLLELHEQACVFFEEQLRTPEGAGAREYLAGRGLGEEGLRKFRIGYAPDSSSALRGYLERWYAARAAQGGRAAGAAEADQAGAGPDGAGAGPAGAERRGERAAAAGQAVAGATLPAGRAGAAGGPGRAGELARLLRLAGLFTAKEQEDGAGGMTEGPLYPRFRRRITFPILNEAGRVIAFTARTLDPKEKAKYLNSPETPLYRKGQVLFNLDKARVAMRQLAGQRPPQDFALLVEGQMDCISVSLAGIANVLATSGTAFTEAQARLLSRYTKRVIVNFDPDAAGAAAAEKSIALLTEEGFEVRVVALEGGLDPDRFVRERGVTAYLGAVRGARRHQEYLIDRARQLYPAGTAQGKIEALNYLLPHIRRMPNGIGREEFASEAAHRLGIDSALLREELRQAAAGRKQALGETRAKVSGAEKDLLWAMAAGAETEEFRAAAAALERHPERFAGLPAEGALRRLLADGAWQGWPEGAEKTLLAGVLLEEGQGAVDLPCVEAALRSLECAALEREGRAVRVELAEAERRGDEAEIVRLMGREQGIKRALREL